MSNAPFFVLKVPLYEGILSKDRPRKQVEYFEFVVSLTNPEIFVR